MHVQVVNSEKELQDAYTVRKVVFVDEQQVPLEEEIDQYETEATHFVLYDSDTAVGAGRFRIVEGIGKVERICVLPSHRSTKGSGRLIMETIEEYAQMKEIHVLKLNAQTHAEPFYAKLGYETVSGTFLDAGIPHVTMTKNI
ncbi:GNAT family N-acetyltransferase [Sutcliffiella rhizosphaerae]|uniref:N-acetyltransferase YjcF n=1 Tax=Sutcliffiella rhizosphaerae TaxID=2880967 RepID=A0ABM8YKK9_9BACI|nr:GNAT family N-acetyltransferase [Sutcliffiella rhizosphaerae]CAG9620480.1 putative N-acetyltransferase YjcF [Sutcliffiella rhizosphaerae]